MTFKDLQQMMATFNDYVTIFKARNIVPDEELIQTGAAITRHYFENTWGKRSDVNAEQFGRLIENSFIKRFSKTY